MVVFNFRQTCYSVTRLVRFTFTSITRPFILLCMGYFFFSFFFNNFLRILFIFDNLRSDNKIILGPRNQNRGSLRERKVIFLDRRSLILSLNEVLFPS